MRLISFLFRYSRVLLVFALLTSFVSGASNVALIAVMYAALGGRRHLFWIFIAVAATQVIARFWSQTLLTLIAQRARMDIRARLCGQILAARLRDLEQIGPSRLLGALTDDLNTLAGTATGIPLYLMQTTVVIGCLIVMLWLSWKLLLGVVLCIALAIFIFHTFSRRGLFYLRKSRAQGDILFGFFRAMTDGVKEIKLHSRRREAFLQDYVGNAEKRLAFFDRRANLLFSGGGSWAQLAFFLILGLLLFAGPSLLGADAKILTGFTMLLIYMQAPIEVVMNGMQSLGYATVTLGRLQALGLTLEKNASETITLEPARSPGTDNFELLEFRGVTHRYLHEMGNSFTLGPLDLTFRRGEIVFLIGGNGSGKTTLAKLLTGLYTPESGEVLLNGQPMDDHNREQLRQNFSAIFADFYLFEGMVGIDAPDVDERARRYLKTLQLENVIQLKDGILSTTSVSQGQRKRLALLTAYMEDRPFYVFDEWAADQDPVFREIFYRTLLPDLRARGKTLLVISHDDRYYALGDRVIKLDFGQVQFDRKQNSIAALEAYSTIAEAHA